MTREQIDAIEKGAFTAGGIPINGVREVCALAREALELREALEISADVHYLLTRESDGSYTCWRSGLMFGEDSNASRPFTGSTPLEAINNARRGM